MQSLPGCMFSGVILDSRTSAFQALHVYPFALQTRASATLIYFTLAHASKFPNKNSTLPTLPFHESSLISEWCVSIGFVWSLKM